MVAEAVALRPIVDIFFNPGPEQCEISTIKSIGQVGDPVRDDKGLFTVIGRIQFFTEFEYLLLVKGLDLSPVFFAILLTVAALTP